MQKLTQLSSSWQQWMQHNLARGCSAESLVESMVRENFDPLFAAASVWQLTTTGSAQLAASAPVQATQRGDYVDEAPRMPFQSRTIHTSDRDVHLTFRVAQPAVALLDDLMSPEECDELVRLSVIKLKRSTIVDPTTGREVVIDERSSDGTYFLLNENDFIARLDRRIAEVMHWPIENGEGIQILRYGVGGEYKTHFDYFPPSDSGSQAHLAKGGQRVSTLVMYLNDVGAGGETVFPHLNLSVVPKKGSAVYFEYCNSRGQVDARTLHGGLPVTAGEKWIATKWMRQRRYA